MKIITLLIDDDDDSRLITRSFLHKQCPEIYIAAEAASAIEGVQMIKQYQPDLLLLDIEMPDGSGFDILKQVPEKKFEVIFVTAFESYAIEAFKYAAVDYLLKPVSINDLAVSVKRAAGNIRKKIFENQWPALSHNLQFSSNYDRKLAIATATGYVFVNVKDIVRCQSSANYTEFFFTGGKKILSSRNLGFFEELLPPEKFCRIHHSHLVNIDFVENYSKRANGGSLQMTDGSELDVSQRKREAFFQRFIIK